MQFLAILLLSLLAAITYGILHDQITARICIEYFTIGHPPIFNTDNPTLLALGWGVVATWWVGVLLGLPLAAAARIGPWPKMSARNFLRPIALLLLCTALMATVAGILGHFAASHGFVHLVGPLTSAVPNDRQDAFITDLWMHLASYGAGFLGGLLLCLRTLARRRRLAGQTVP